MRSRHELCYCGDGSEELYPWKKLAILQRLWGGGRRERLTIAVPEIAWEASAPAMVFVVPMMIMAITVRLRLMMVIFLRPSKSERVPTKGAIAPTAIVYELRS